MGSILQETTAGHINPLNQDLLLRLVLEHVGKANVTDLKNCRLVNHSWNRAAVQVLEEEHNYALETDLKKLIEFKHLLWRTQLSRIKSEHRELASLRLSIKLDSVVMISKPETLEFVVGAASAVSWTGKAGRILQLNPQLRVAFIYYTSFTKVEEEEEEDQQKQDQREVILENQELFNLLNLTSTTLKSISIDSEFLVCPHFEEFDFDSSFLTFPSLTFLEYKIRIFRLANLLERVRREEMFDLTKHVISIIQGAPKLTKLSLYLWDGDLERTTISLHAIMKSCADRLEELEFDISLEGKELDAFKALSEIKFPALRLLTMIDGYTGLYSSNKWFNLFLKNNCPTLQRLEVDWSGTYFDEEEPMLLEFPTLPNILHFTLNLAYSSSPSLQYLERVHSTFSTLMMGLPSLKTCNISLAVLLILGAHLKNSGHLPLLAPPPDISTLEISVYVDDVDEEETLDLFDRATFVYYHTFPNLRKLVIKPSYYSSSSVEKVTLAIEFLCSHHGIKILEIQNYAQPWLDHFSLNQTLQGLKILKLFSPKTVTGPQLDPVQLLKRFPVLELLQFGKQMVSANQIQTFREMLKIFDSPVSY